MYIIKNVCSVKFFVCTLWPEFSKYRFSANKSLSLRIQQEAERFSTLSREQSSYETIQINILLLLLLSRFCRVRLCATP